MDKTGPSGNIRKHQEAQEAQEAQDKDPAASGEGWKLWAETDTLTSSRQQSAPA
jgi:hypothetical protein